MDKKSDKIDSEKQRDDEAGYPMLPIGKAVDSTKDTTTVPTDIIEKCIGEMGKYQIFLCLIIFLTKFAIAFNQLAIIFLAPKIEHHCEGASNSTKLCEDSNSTDSCVNATNAFTNTCPCENPVYNKEIFEDTISMSWHLICDRAWMANMNQMILMLGILVGSIGFGTLADMYGRRNPLIWSVILQVVAGTAASQAPDFWSFTVLRFLVGGSIGGMMVAGYVLCLEFVGKKYREPISALYQLPFNFGHLMLAGIGYLFRGWSAFHLAITLPSIILLSYYWILPESPRWLLSTGDTKGAIKTLEKSAKFNKLPVDKIADDVQYYQDSKPKTQLQKRSFLDLFKTPNIRKYTLCMVFNWLVCGYGFYGISQYIGQFGGNIFVNVAGSAFITIPATLLSIPLMKRVGRRSCMIGSLSITSVCLFAIAAIPLSYHMLKVCLACVGNASIFISFIVVYLYASEIFPTVIRNAGIGLSSMAARIGAMIAPYVTGLNSVATFLPPVLFGILPLIAALLCLMLPETKDCELTNTIEEAENFKANRTSKNSSEK